VNENVKHIVVAIQGPSPGHEKNEAEAPGLPPAESTMVDYITSRFCIFGEDRFYFPTANPNANTPVVVLGVLAAENGGA
jgi:hypothetical protein